MNKTLTVRQFAAIKRIAQNVNPLVIKKNKISNKIKELNAEFNSLSEEIEGHEMGVKALTGGFTSEDLIEKRVENTGKIDKDGKSIKVTKYEPSSIIIFNEESNTYEINIPEVELEEISNTEEIDSTEKLPEVEVSNYEISTDMSDK